MKGSSRRPHSLVWMWVIVATLGLFDVLAHAQTPSALESRYVEARRQYQKLVSRLDVAENRPLFRKNMENFQEILRQDGADRLADRCLFMIAQSYHHLYDAQKLEEDYKNALVFYKQTALRYPQSPLADDALFLSGVLLEARNPADAYVEFERVSVLFPQGDLSPRARQKAQDLAAKLNEKPSTPPPDAPKVSGQQAQAAQKTSSPGEGKGLGNEPGQLREPSAENPKAVVEKIHHWSADEYTRVVVYLSRPVKYTRSEFLAVPKEKRPPRIVLDLERCGVRPKLKPMIRIMDGLLQDVRVESAGNDKTQVVLDLQSVESYRVFSLADPFRVVIDVLGERKAEPAAAAAPPKTSPAPPPPNAVATPVLKKGMPSMIEQLGLTVRRIVIDPGHGGKDKGAIGPSGVFEKDITLAIAKRLKSILEKEGGYEVFLTRSTDRFLSLEERTAIANTKKADLFLSIHTNAHTDPGLGGIETYFLNFSKDKESARVAAFENATSAKQISDLEAILNDLLRNTKISESSRLAQEVHHRLIESLEPNVKVRDLGVKQAPFYVLLGAQMPSILIEACFISNVQEERLLKDADFQNELAKAISVGIRSYKDRLAQVGRRGEGA